MTRCEDCERLEAKLLRADRKLVELTGECNRLGNMAVQFGSQNGVFQNRARDLRVERDDARAYAEERNHEANKLQRVLNITAQERDEARAEVERLREVVRGVHAMTGRNVNWTTFPEEAATALREIHKLTKEAVEHGNG